MMRRILSTLTVCLVAIPAWVGAGVAVAAGGTPIGPGQHFIGPVNGSNDDPIVYTVCPGPATLHRKGPVAGGQTMAVAEVADGTGYTGLFSTVYAWFMPVRSGSTPRQLKFTTYGSSKSIPTSIRVPCDGEGTVVFSSCPYLAPCAAGWVPDNVDVQFVNIAD
jgi:hypothetical protein